MTGVPVFARAASSGRIEPLHKFRMLRGNVSVCPVDEKSLNEVVPKQQHELVIVDMGASWNELKELL